MKRTPAIPSPSSVLVIYVSRIGDTMLITPAIRALACAWPAASVDFLGSKTSADVIRHLAFVRDVGTLSKKSVRLRGWFRRKSYDLALVYGYDGDGPFVDYALRVARSVVAFRQIKTSLNGRLWAVVDKPAFQSCHAVDHCLSMIAPLGIPSAGKYLSYAVTVDERRWAEAELAPLLARGADPLIGLQIASFPTKGYRDWPVARFIELCHRIRADHPAARFLIFGGMMELDRTVALHAAFPDCSSHYAGRLSLRQTAALMNRLDCYVGVDTGPTHIMGALHRPMVALYHCYSPARLLAPLEHPCCWAIDHPRAEQGCTPETPMSEITVDRVWDAVRRALAECSPAKRNAIRDV